jgi:two-component system, NarL family, nitrate/nitrite response regulator NarL
MLEATSMISALICDTHRLFGESFANALRGEGARVTVTSGPTETLAAIGRRPVDRVVMDVRFAEGLGLAAIRHVRNTWPLTHVSGVGTDDPELVRSAIDAGAHVLLSKKRPLSELVHTVIRASRGPATIDDAGPSPCSGSARRDYPLAAQFLTNREREVLRLLVSAQPTDRIADQLGISVTTTRGYLQSILEKFGVHSRVEALAYAIEHSVVS